MWIFRILSDIKDDKFATLLCFLQIPLFCKIKHTQNTYVQENDRIRKIKRKENSFFENSRTVRRTKYSTLTVVKKKVLKGLH